MTGCRDRIAPVCEVEPGHNGEQQWVVQELHLSHPGGGGDTRSIDPVRSTLHCYSRCPFERRTLSAAVNAAAMQLCTAFSARFTQIMTGWRHVCDRECAVIFQLSQE